MAGNCVLLTGATGFVGFKVLLDLLKAGYTVHCAVRSQAKADALLANPALRTLSPSPTQLSFAIVSDMAVENAYDAALQDVRYVIHIAGPLVNGNPIPPEKYESTYVTDYVTGTIGLLKSAQNAGTVRRILVANSLLGVIPFEYFTGAGDYSVVFTPDSRVPDMKTPYPVEFMAYTAGKVAEINAVEEFVKTEGQNLNLDVIHMLMPIIIGRDERATSAASLTDGLSTNSAVMGILKGAKNDIPFNGNMVLVDDASRTFIKSLDSAVPSSRSLMLGVNITWQDAVDIAKRLYPEAMAKGLLSAEGTQHGLPVLITSKETEELLGFKFAGLEDIVKSVVGQYLQLSAKA